MLSRRSSASRPDPPEGEAHPLEFTLLGREVAVGPRLHERADLAEEVVARQPARVSRVRVTDLIPGAIGVRRAATVEIVGDPVVVVVVAVAALGDVVVARAAILVDAVGRAV